MTNKHAIRTLTIWGLIAGILSFASGLGAHAYFAFNSPGGVIAYEIRHGYNSFEKQLLHAAEGTHTTGIILMILGAVLIFGAIAKHLLHWEFSEKAAKLLVVITSTLILALTLLAYIPSIRYCNYFSF